MISVWAIRATSARPSSDVAAIDAMITGDALMSSALTVGDDRGRQARRPEVLLDLGSVALTSVP